MELGFGGTLVILVLAVGLVAFAVWRASQPSDPSRIRMVNYTYVQFAGVLLVLLMLAHLLTLAAGHPVTGRSLGIHP